MLHAPLKPHPHTHHYHTGTNNKHSLVNWAFDVYSTSGEGLGVEDVVCLMNEVFGKKQLRNSRITQRLHDHIFGQLQTLASAGGGFVTRADFCKFAATHPKLMFPAFELQIQVLPPLHCTAAH